MLTQGQKKYFIAILHLDTYLINEIGMSLSFANTMGGSTSLFAHFTDGSVLGLRELIDGI